MVLNIILAYIENNNYDSRKSLFTIFDKNIQKNINNSPIWNEAYKEDEISDLNKPLYYYKIKFDGLKPIMCMKISKIRNI